MSNAGMILGLVMGLSHASPISAQFNLGPLSASEIRLHMLGHHLQGEYANGAQWRERLNRDLSTVYVEGDKHYTGLMTFKGNQLCFIYDEAPQVSGGCFEVWRRGTNCFDFYGTEETAGFLQRQTGRGWTARAWKTSKASTCQADLIG